MKSALKETRFASIEVVKEKAIRDTELGEEDSYRPVTLKVVKGETLRGSSMLR